MKKKEPTLQQVFGKDVIKYKEHSIEGSSSPFTKDLFFTQIGSILYTYNVEAGNLKSNIKRVKFMHLVKMIMSLICYIVMIWICSYITNSSIFDSALLLIIAFAAALLYITDFRYHLKSFHKIAHRQRWAKYKIAYLKKEKYKGNVSFLEYDYLSLGIVDLILEKESLKYLDGIKADMDMHEFIALHKSYEEVKDENERRINANGFQASEQNRA